MANNFLNPESIPHIAEALIDRTAGEHPGRAARAILVRRIIVRLHENEADAAPIRHLPDAAPQWAQVAPASYVIPSQETQLEIRMIASSVARAERLIASGTLKTRESGLHAELTAMVRGLSHQSWEDMVERCRKHGARAQAWEDAQADNGLGRVIAGCDGRFWTLLSSVQQLWDVSEGTSWCVRKDLTTDQVQFLRIQLWDGQYWVLGTKDHSEVLVHLDEFGNIDEIKDRKNQIPYKFRRDVLKLIADARLSINPKCSDSAAIGLLLEEGAPCAVGVIHDVNSGASIPYRLWWFSSNERLAIGFGSGGEDDPERFVHLQFGSEGAPYVVGATPKTWTALVTQLVGRVLNSVYPEGERPDYTQRAFEALTRVHRYDEYWNWAVVPVVWEPIEFSNDD